MKKIVFLALVVAILTGCSNNNYLDEKIKCKNLANERIEEIRGPSVTADKHLHMVDLMGINYSPILGTCLIAYSKTISNVSTSKVIEDLLSGQAIASFTQILNPLDGKFTEIGDEDDFYQKFKLYFSDGAE